MDASAKASHLRRRSMNCAVTTASAPLANPTNPGSRLDKLKTVVERRFKSIIISNSHSPFPSARATATPTPSARASTKKKRRRAIVTDMIGFPQDFTHASHIGVHEVRQLAYQPRHSVGPSLSLFEASGKLSSVYRLPEREPDFSFMDGRDDLMAELDTICSNNNPNTARRTSLLPIRTVQPSVSSNKVKRKSVPVHALKEVSQAIAGSQEVVLPTRHSVDHDDHIRVSCLSIEKSLKALVDCSYEERSIEPVVDERGRSLRMVGGEYMSDTVKAKWDKKMAEVALSLKAENQ